MERMSKNISQEKHFIHLLLNSTKDQRRALLYTITPRQLLAISEISHNLLHLPMSNSNKGVIEKRRKTLQNISDRSKSIRTRTFLVKKHMKLLLDTLKLVKSPLQELLS